MFGRPATAVLGLLLVACKSGGGANTVCDDLCDQLVNTCQIPAYPTSESCVAGCLYNAEQGGDVLSELACIEQAQCDEFAIVECEHQYGIE
jgi:hypothetical protein